MTTSNTVQLELEFTDGFYVHVSLAKGVHAEDLDPYDRDAHILGSYYYHEDTAEDALEAFHFCVPIAKPEDFDITCKPHLI